MTVRKKNDILFSIHLTPIGEENAPVVDTGAGHNSENDPNLTNPLSTGPSEFMAAATGRIC